MIFEREPTFHERQAFVRVMRQKWMCNHKMTSVFNRLKSYNNQKKKESVPPHTLVVKETKIAGITCQEKEVRSEESSLLK
jgi:hypothetical protein